MAIEPIAKGWRIDEDWKKSSMLRRLIPRYGVSEVVVICTPSDIVYQAGL
jgi:hypothetical protein